MKKTFLISTLAAFAIVGCGGSDSSSPSIPLNRVAYVAELSATQDAIYSANPDGSGVTLHSKLSKDVQAFDVDQTGTALLAVVYNSTKDSYDVKLCGLDGTVKKSLTNLDYDEITNVQFNRSYTKVVVSGFLNGGVSSILTVNADGTGVQTVNNQGSLGVFTSSGKLAIGGETSGEVSRSFVGTMDLDGGAVSNLVANVEPLALDELNGAIAYAASIGGDASGVSGISLVQPGMPPRALYVAGTTIDSDPRFSTDGTAVFFVRDGSGIFRVPLGGGVPTSIVANRDVSRILRVR